MKYRIVDATGTPIAEIKFHPAIHHDLVDEYLQDISQLLDAAGYHSITIPVTEEEA